MPLYHKRYIFLNLSVMGGGDLYWRIYTSVPPLPILPPLPTLPTITPRRKFIIYFDKSRKYNYIVILRSNFVEIFLGKFWSENKVSVLIWKLWTMWFHWVLNFQWLVYWSQDINLTLWLLSSHSKSRKWPKTPKIPKNR